MERDAPQGTHLLQRHQLRTLVAAAATPNTPGELTTIYLLSPASSHGVRGTRLRAALRDADPCVEAPASLGEAFARISALYFRGKLTYARHFGGPPQARSDPALVITPSQGLLPASAPVDAALLDEFAATAVDPAEPAFMKPFLRSLSTLSAEPALKEIVFLGSLATPKYTRPLHEALGDRIKVPREFPGMGNLQRGSLLLKAVDAGVPVSLIPLSACL